MLRGSVFCPVDFSEASCGALRYAAAVAEHFFVTLTVAAVDDPLLSEASAIAHGDGSLAKRTREELARLVARTFGQRTLTVPRIDLDVGTGKPATEIRRLAIAHGADLIVMSSHGRSGVRKMLLGSTTERVLRETEIPVLVTPATDPGPASLEALKPGLRVVLAPVDLTTASAQQVQIASGLATAMDAQLLLLHVLDPLPMMDGRDPLMIAADAARRERAERALRELAGAPPTSARAETLIVDGDPVAMIRGIVRHRDAGIVVMGLHSTPRFGPRMGSVTYRVLCATVTPVLALPPVTAAIEPLAETAVGAWKGE